MVGTVTRIASVSCQVDADEGVYACAVRGRLTESDTGQSKPLAVGDRVEFAVGPEGGGVVERILPRRTKLSRAHPHDPRIEKVIVANVDQALVISSIKTPPLSVGIIDRYVIAAQVGGLEAIVCINKIDLAGDEAQCQDIAKLYRHLELKVVLTSARTGAGLDELACVLRGKSSVLAGHSGVGKSSLINALQPGLRLKTGTVREGHKGRHVTSSVSLLKLDLGGYVVDTPGIREFTLWDIEKRDVAQFFPDIWELSHQCKMPDCIHLHETQCAVQEALQTGDLPPVRYESYQRIVDSIEETSIPRETDVERPDEQIAKRKRRPSRQRRRQWGKDRVDDEMQQRGDATSPKVRRDSDADSPHADH